MPEFTDDDWRRGRRLLRQLLPAARAEARKAAMTMHLGSALGRTQRPYATEDNIEALMVYPAPMGGWHTDLVLRTTPPGVPNTMGSPVNRPHKTREEAERACQALLTALLASEAEARAAPKLPPKFLLYDAEIDLDPKMLVLARKRLGKDEIGKEEAIAMIEAMMSIVFPGKWSYERFDALQQSKDHGAQATLLAALHLATFAGVYTYPPRRDASPSGHQAPPATPH